MKYVEVITYVVCTAEMMHLSYCIDCSTTQG